MKMQSLGKTIANNTVFLYNSNVVHDVCFTVHVALISCFIFLC